MITVGCTTGLSIETCDKATYSAEQVLVWLDPMTNPRAPVLIEGWVGYEIPGRIRMTKKQATDLIALLAQAVGKL